MQRRYWTQEEDQTLKIIVQSMTEVNWTLAALRLKNAVHGSDRNSKQCRQRWLNKLNRNGSDDLPWGTQEDQIILQQFITHHKCEKNKWIILAQKLKKNQNFTNSSPERAPNEIKNRFYSIVRKGIRRINNKLGRPISPEEIRLVKPITTSKLFENMEEDQCREVLFILYGMASDRVQNFVIENEPSKQKLQGILELIINLNRSEQKIKTELRSSLIKLEPIEPEMEVEPIVPKQTLKKRKSSLSTVEEQKLDNLNRSTKICSTEDNMRELDIIDLFIGNCLYLHESASLQFEEIDFGI